MSHAGGVAEDVIRVLHDRRRVVAGFPLSAPAVGRIQELVGGGCEIVDIRRADGRERLVLAPPVSPQLLARLKSAFPDARIVIVELSDADYGVRLGGPVTRALDAGADGYVTARSLGELAEMLRAGTVAADPVSAPAALTEGVADDLSAALDEVLARRPAAHADDEASRRHRSP